MRDSRSFLNGSTQWRRKCEARLIGGSRRATGDNPGLVGKAQRRYSARRTVEIVLRLLYGEDLELLSWELIITSARPSKWRGQFLKSRPNNLKETPPGRMGHGNRPVPAKAIGITST
jgi:hypothetical protein